MQACMHCFFLKGKGTKAISPWKKAPYEEIVNFYFSTSKAPRQWLRGMEATAFVVSVKYLACYVIIEKNTFWNISGVKVDLLETRYQWQLGNLTLLLYKNVTDYKQSIIYLEPSLAH